MYQDSIHGKCECSLEPFQLRNLYHNSNRSNLVLTSHFQKEKEMCVTGSELQPSVGWQLRCYAISKDRLKYTRSHQT